MNGLQKAASSSAAAALRGTDAGLAADETVIEMRALRRGDHPHEGSAAHDAR
ncbi:MAG: hypothetical protein HFJ69_06075 [Enterorhabdus sp.]|nr:hypothetical protein [Enterorhabdus sp.]